MPLFIEVTEDGIEIRLNEDESSLLIVGEFFIMFSCLLIISSFSFSYIEIDGIEGADGQLKNAPSSIIVFGDEIQRLVKVTTIKRPRTDTRKSWWNYNFRQWGASWKSRFPNHCYWWWNLYISQRCTIYECRFIYWC